ncbi:MAG: FAD-dependent oxidoreductase [Elusimicrobia bacterium]|nr:FAD-dependent oxidoreductase [Elusimicrobiota bacterium]
MKVIILGGGITGLSAALKLAEKGITDIEVLEENNYVGGLAASVKIDGNIFDYGPHAYHSNTTEILLKLKKLAGDNFVELKKNVKIKFRGKYYKYPLEAIDIVFKLNPFLAIACIVNYIYVNIKNNFIKGKIKSTEDWLVKGFGKTLYNIYFGPYTQKVWGIKPSQLSPLFAMHRIPHTSLITVAAKSFLKGVKKLTHKEHKYSPLVIEFFYPKNGAGFIPNQMAKIISENKGKISLNSKMIGLNIEDKKVKSVICKTADGIKEIKGDYYISTIPITDLISYLKPLPPNNITSLSENMFYRAIVVVCLLINKPKVFDAEWIYFTNRTFNRLSDIRNCGAINAIQEGKTGLMAEITCNFGDDIWNTDKNILCHKVIRELEEEGFINKNDVLKYDILKVKNGYPVYDLDYEVRMEKITKYIENISNLFITGRQGLFKYVDMDVAVEMGETVADHILNKKSKNEISKIPFEEKLYA